MDQFTDIQIVEANRLHSEEAKSGNNENTSLWTNNLQDILMLNPKDKVSVHGAFISERGVGQSTSIEIKGEELGDQRSFTYTNLSRSIVTGDRLDNNLPSRASIITGENKTDTLTIKDNQLKFVINYFIPANAQNSVHLPRRYMWNYAQERDNLLQKDDRENQGATRTFYNRSNYSTTNKLYQAPALYNVFTTPGEGDLLKPLNDNSRYTLMIRDKTFYTSNSLGILGEDDLPEDDMRDPENAIYRTYRELKEIEIPGGFNSPEFIATEISRQLQNIVNDQVLIQDNTGSDAFPQPFMKIVESETYKAFYSGNVHDNTEDNFFYYFNLNTAGNTAGAKEYRTGHTNASGFEWLRQYGIIACKYPELYETGRLINQDVNGSYTGIRGSEVYFGMNMTTATSDSPLKLVYEYNASNCQLLKDFFDAQKLYPEIITNLNDPKSGYNDGCTIDNTRWIHINRHDENKQSLAKPVSYNKTQLGYGGYYEPRSYVPSATTQLQSLLLPLYFDHTQEDIFYEDPQFGLDQFTYGCIGKWYESTSKKYHIAIYPFKHVTNGIGSPPFEELKATGTGNPVEIEGGRRIGFDMHFNAPGMYYLLPLSGFTTHPTPTSSYSSQLAIYNVNAPNTDGGLVAPTYFGNPYQKLLYIGADNPQLNWDGTNFNFSYLHTSMNRGNSINGGLPVVGVDTDDNAQDEVYKMNPIELFNDWTPDRCPMSGLFTIYPFDKIGTTGFQISHPNSNLNPYQIFDQLCGIMIEDFGVGEELWTRSLWGLLGFSYKQFHGTNNRLARIQRGNANNLSVVTTNAEVVEGDTKIYSTNWASTPMYNNMIQTPFSIKGYNASGTIFQSYNKVIANIIHKTTSMTIIADNLPTRMIRGYYTIRSNILEGTPYIGGKINNTTMPIIGVVNKISNFGDFTFGEESSLQFTITKPVRLASLSVSVHDPDGSYARTSEQSTILFKVERPVVATFNVAQQILQEEQQGKK